MLNFLTTDMLDFLADLLPVDMLDLLPNLLPSNMSNLLRMPNTYWNRISQMSKINPLVAGLIDDIQNL